MKIETQLWICAGSKNRNTKLLVPYQTLMFKCTVMPKRKKM